MPKIKFSKVSIERLKHGDKQIYYYDTEIPGWFLCVGQTKKSWGVHNDLDGKSVKVTLGTYPMVDFERARNLARESLLQMKKGVDPRQKREKRKVTTLGDAFDDYLKKKTLKPKTLRSIKTVRSLYISDWEKLPVGSITKEMISDKHKELGGIGKATANQVMRYVRAIMNWCKVFYGVKENPVQALSLSKSWFKVRRRRTCIKQHFLKTWYDEVAKEPDDVRDYLTWLLYTGMRREEALALEWSNIDFKGRLFVVLDTKNGDPLELPLPKVLYEILERRKGNHEKFVFPCRGTKPSLSGHMGEPRLAMDGINKRASMTITYHDLRRTFMTVAESLDISYYALKTLVNHSTGGDEDVTAGYIIMSVDRLREPVNKIADFISEKIK
jgi:integrase